MVVQEEDEEIEMHGNRRPAGPPTASRLQYALVEAFRGKMEEDHGQGEEKLLRMQ